MILRSPPHRRGIAAALVILSFAVSPQPRAQPSPDLAIGGLVQAGALLKPEDLGAGCTRRTIEDRRIIEQAGRREERVVRWSGCLLRELLDRAKPVERARNDLRTAIVVATATDGYRALFSWAELWNSPIGDGVLVITEKDGEALGPDEGRFALRSFGDTRPGPRHVRWLKSVEVTRLGH